MTAMNSVRPVQSRVIPFFVGFSLWGGAIFFAGGPPRSGKGAGKQTGETVCRLPFRLSAVQENGEWRNEKVTLC